MLTTCAAVILIVFGIISDMPKCFPDANLPAFQTGRMFTSLGIFMFSFGGHGSIETVDYDYLSNFRSIPNHSTRHATTKTV